MKVSRLIFFIPRQFFLIIIKVYQRTLSPDHGFLRIFFPHGFCKYHPSCSEYGYETIRKNGLFKGIPKALWRIVRCNPFSKGGIDLP
ncbi:MAG: membrane protein insertion efficiency factor YidD [bacterium]